MSIGCQASRKFLANDATLFFVVHDSAKKWRQRGMSFAQSPYNGLVVRPKRDPSD
jgi:hypothetical protein